MTFVEAYLAGSSAKELGAEMGITARSVQRRLKKIGVIRSKSESFRVAIEQGRMTYDHLKKQEHTRDSRKTINVAMRYRVFKRDKFRCVFCGNGAKEGARLQVDHIVALCDGGEHTEKNMQTACLECNVGKYHQNPVNRGKHK